MVAFTQTTYTSAAALKTAVDAIENTVVIHVVSYIEGGNTKFLLIT